MGLIINLFTLINKIIMKKNIIILLIAVLLIVIIYLLSASTKDSDIKVNESNGDITATEDITAQTSENFGSGVVSGVDVEKRIVEYAYTYTETDEAFAEVFEDTAEIKLSADAKIYSAPNASSFDNLTEISLNDIELGQNLFFKIELIDGEVEGTGSGMIESDELIIILE